MSTQDCRFPFHSVGSLRPLAEFWRKQARDPESMYSERAARLIRSLEDHPEIEGDYDDLSVLDPHREVVDAMFDALLPAAERDGTILLGGVPFGDGIFYQSPAAREAGLMDAMASDYCMNVSEDMWEIGSTVTAYSLILSRVYGVETDFDYPIIATIPDPDTGLARHLRLRWDPQFLEVRVREEVREIRDEDVARLVAEPMNLPLWLEVLPPEGFEFHGLSLLHAVDVTADHALSLLKNDLLATGAMASPERLDHLQYRVRTLMRRSDLRLGLLAIETGDDVEAITTARPLGRSLLIREGESPDCPFKEDSYYAAAFETREPLIVYDLETCEVCTGFEQALRDQGFRNLLLWPLYSGGRLVGMAELASPTPGAINSFNSLKLAEVQGLLATAIERATREREDRLQAVIKTQYTAIHPAVEWRFREAAQRFIAREAEGEAPEAEPVVFQGVYPLYGLTDIRGSSDLRNQAVQGDLLEQLDLAEGVLRAAHVHQPLPALDQLLFRLSTVRGRVSEGLRSEDETAVLEFLQREVEPRIPHLAAMDRSVSVAADAYHSSLDPGLKILYRRRKAFEDSVARVNGLIGNVLSEEQAEAQRMHPHYFEQFKTDGVEYTIYIGDSISGDGSFHPMHLHNLRLWQLMAMCKVEWALQEAVPDLDLPLESTHLVLVQDHPLSVRFRVDEKKFDVDGAYNIRYEIAKKRIDKALIRGSGERLTQPGTLSVVYSQPREGSEYRGYLEFLAARGFVEGELEEFELEDVPGIQGLRALRIRVAGTSPAAFGEPELLAFPVQSRASSGFSAEAS